MQREQPDVAILGVNGIGYESRNDDITAGRDLPWLQDTPEAEAWTTWGIAYRDVVVLDAEGAVVGIFNLTEHDLGDPAHYATLEALLVR